MSLFKSLFTPQSSNADKKSIDQSLLNKRSHLQNRSQNDIKKASDRSFNKKPKRITIKESVYDPSAPFQNSNDERSNCLESASISKSQSKPSFNELNPDHFFCFVSFKSIPNSRHGNKKVPINLLGKSNFMFNDE